MKKSTNNSIVIYQSILVMEPKPTSKPSQNPTVFNYFFDLLFIIFIVSPIKHINCV